jgi:hypothetical protein
MPKNVVKDSENQNTIKLHADGNLTWNNDFVIASNYKLNSVVWVRERTIPTERPPLVNEVSANF